MLQIAQYSNTGWCRNVISKQDENNVRVISMRLLFILQEDQEHIHFCEAYRLLDASN